MFDSGISAAELLKPKFEANPLQILTGSHPMHLETFHSFHPRVRSVAPPLPPLHWQTAAVLYVFNLFLFVAGIADAVFLKIDLLARL